MTHATGSAAIDDTAAESSKSPLRRLLFALAVLTLLCALCAPFFVNTKATGAPEARGGALSYRGWGPLDAPVDLAGEWRFLWRGGGKEPGPAPGTVTTIRVPGTWSSAETPAGSHFPDNGAATYALSIRELAPGRYTLHVPIIFAASRISVNGEAVSEQGKVGATAATSETRFRSHEIAVEHGGGTLELRIDAASFQHRDNGIETAPVFGLAGPMRSWIALQWSQGYLFNAALLLLTAYGLVVFLFRPQDRASLFFALSCLLFLPTAAAFRYDNLLQVAFPGLGFGAMLALIYLSGIASISFFLAYVDALFPRERVRPLFLGFLAAFAAMFAWQSIAFLRGDTLLASYSHQWCLAIAALAMLYIAAVVLVAALRGRNGAIVFLLGIGVFITTFLLGAAVATGLLPRDRLVAFDFQAVGMLLLLFSHIVILAERWSIAIEATEQINDDLRRLIEVNSAITTEMRLSALLTKIVQVTTRIIHADRSSLFLHDPKTGELWSLVAEGVEKREIRFDSTVGLAGHSFTHGEVVNVAKAYDDPRFNPALDEMTGYRTESIVSIPVVTRDGRRLGVMQALNRHNAKGFSDNDIVRMSAFAAQAAVAIDNATLFSEVVAARNYNESILRSMSSGVITFDRDARLAKMNEAACAILGLTPEQIADADALALLQTGNEWLIPELDAVRASGSPKTMLDVDIRTVRGETASVNLSIVPLMGESERVGLLLLIEDISEGKRLQGAMRRFMTAEVVDQVLARGDDRLFGSACQASVLFADIRGFTTMAEALTPRETVDTLNETFTELFEAVAAAGGNLDKFIGDAIMAVYGAPLSSGRDPENAVESALRMLTMIDALNAGRANGQPPLRLGVGITTGEVIAGTIGSPKRMDYTVIGDSVNLAARLQDITKSYQVEMIVCEATAAAVAATHRLRELDIIRVRGRRQPAKIFQVLRPNGDGAAHQADAMDAYQRGRDALARADWAAAMAAFEEAATLDPGDRPAAMMRDRAQLLARDPPEAGWDGVWHAPAD